MENTQTNLKIPNNTSTVVRIKSIQNTIQIWRVEPESAILIYFKPNRKM